MNRIFSNDPIIENIIKKRLIQSLTLNQDTLLFRYLQYILDALPTNKQELEDDDRYLFLELVEILDQYKENKLIKSFMKNKIFQKHLFSTLNFNALKNIYQIKPTKEFDEEDVTIFKS